MVDKKNNTSKNADTMIDPWNQDPFNQRILLDFHRCLRGLISDVRWNGRVPHNADEMLDNLLDADITIGHFLCPATRADYNHNIDHAVDLFMKLFFDGDPTIPSCYDDREKLSEMQYYGTIDHLLMWIRYSLEEFSDYIDDDPAEHLIELWERVEILSSEIADLEDTYIG